MKFFVVISSVFLLVLSSATAQTINLTSPSSTVTAYEGDDYASSILGNPWDENERRDIGWEENLIGSGQDAVRVEGGILKAKYKSENGYFFPLFQGFTSSIFAEGLPGDRTLPRFGRNHPVDTSKYRFLSYRMNVSTHSVASVSWSKTTQTEGGGWPAERATYFDGYYGYTQGFARSGWHTYLFDMSQLATTFGSGLYNGSWSGNLISLRIEPSSYATAGTDLQLDWVRLSDPSSAPQLTINWNTSGVDSIPDRVVSVAYTTNPLDRSQGAPIANFAKVDPGTFQFPLAALPPGDYYFFVYAHPPTSSSTILAQSALSSKITILPAPNGYFTSPTQASGEDYATTVIGNPWDMDGPVDVDNLRTDVWPDLWRQFSNYSFTGGEFTATANAPLSFLPHSDNQVHMNVDRNHPIDTNKYRYINYRMEVDSSNHPTIAEKVTDGWVTRVVGWNFGPTSPPNDEAFLPAAHVTYEGRHTYTYDLWDETPEALDLGKSFRLRPWMYHFRIDPLEVVVPTRFSIDYVTLNAEPRPDTSGIYPVSFVLEGNTNANVSLYYDSNNTGYDGTLITTATNLAPGSHTINWNTTGLNSSSKFYVYLVVTAGSSTRRFYSPVPIALGSYVDPVPPIATPDPTLAPTTPTPEPRAGGGVAFRRAGVSPKAAKRGRSVKFSAQFSSTPLPTSVKVRLVLGARTQTLTLTKNSKGIFVGSWNAKMRTKGKKDTFKVIFDAIGSDNSAVSRESGNLTISK